MSKLEDFERNIRSALEADRFAIQNEINQLQKDLDEKISEVAFVWKTLGAGIIIWGLDFAMASGIGEAKNPITILFILLSALIVYVGGTLLALSILVSIFWSVYKWIVISSLESKIGDKRKDIRNLDTDLGKLSKT